MTQPLMLIPIRMTLHSSSRLRSTSYITCQALVSITKTLSGAETSNPLCRLGSARRPEFVPMTQPLMLIPIRMTLHSTSRLRSTSSMNLPSSGLNHLDVERSRNVIEQKLFQVMNQKESVLRVKVPVVERSRDDNAQDLVPM